MATKIAAASPLGLDIGTTAGTDYTWTTWDAGTTQKPLVSGGSGDPLTGRRRLFVQAQGPVYVGPTDSVDASSNLGIKLAADQVYELAGNRDWYVYAASTTTLLCVETTDVD